MWLPWRKISRCKSTVSSVSLSSASFSFKDINYLLLDDEPTTAPIFPSAVFRRSFSATAALRSRHPFLPPPLSDPAAADHNRSVVYYTSLRVVRRTFEDCYTVRSILRGFGVAMDERDLSMDWCFLAELQRVLGGKAHLTLPRVFFGGRHIGGADEIWRLHETGELKKFVKGILLAALGVC